MGAALSLIMVEENPGSALMFCDLQHAVPLYFCSLFFFFLQIGNRLQYVSLVSTVIQMHTHWWSQTT